MLFSGSSLMSTAGSTSSAVKADTSIGSIAHMSPTCKNLEPTACVCRCSASHPAGICPSAMSCSRKRSPLRFSKAIRLQSHVDGQHLRAPLHQLAVHSVRCQQCKLHADGTARLTSQV